MTDARALTEPPKGAKEIRAILSLDLERMEYRPRREQTFLHRRSVKIKPPPNARIVLARDKARAVADASTTRWPTRSPRTRYRPDYKRDRAVRWASRRLGRSRCGTRSECGNGRGQEATKLKWRSGRRMLRRAYELFTARQGRWVHVRAQTYATEPVARRDLAEHPKTVGRVVRKKGAS